MVIGCQGAKGLDFLEMALRVVCRLLLEHFHGSLCCCYGIVKWLLRDLWLQEHRLVVAGVFCVVARELMGVL